jgi:hypothetical protein
VYVTPTKRTRLEQVFFFRKNTFEVKAMHAFPGRQGRYPTIQMLVLFLNENRTPSPPWTSSGKN